MENATNAENKSKEHGLHGKLNEAEAKAIPEKILQMWSEIGIKQEGVDVSRIS